MKYVVEPPLMASSLQQPFFFLPWLTVHAMAFDQTFLQRPLQRVPNCQNNLPTTAIFFSDEKVKDGKEMISVARRFLIAASLSIPSKM